MSTPKDREGFCVPISFCMSPCPLKVCTLSQFHSACLSVRCKSVHCPNFILHVSLSAGSLYTVPISFGMSPCPLEVCTLSQFHSACLPVRWKSVHCLISFCTSLCPLEVCVPVPISFCVSPVRCKSVHLPLPRLPLSPSLVSVSHSFLVLSVPVVLYSVYASPVLCVCLSVLSVFLSVYFSMCLFLCLSFDCVSQMFTSAIHF